FALVAGRRACEYLGGVSRKAKLAILIVNHFIARKPTRQGTRAAKLRRTLIRPPVIGDEDTGAARSSLKTATARRIPRNHHRGRSLIRPRVIGDEDTGAAIPNLKTAAAWRIPRNQNRGRALIRPRVIGVEDAVTIDSLKTATTRRRSRKRVFFDGHQRS